MARVWLARGKGRDEKSAKVQIGLRPVQKCKGKMRRQRTHSKGRGVASPRPPRTECKAEPCPYPRALLARDN